MIEKVQADSTSLSWPGHTTLNNNCSITGHCRDYMSEYFSMAITLPWRSKGTLNHKERLLGRILMILWTDLQGLTRPGQRSRGVMILHRSASRSLLIYSSRSSEMTYLILILNMTLRSSLKAARPSRLPRGDQVNKQNQLEAGKNLIRTFQTSTFSI